MKPSSVASPPTNHFTLLANTGIEVRARLNTVRVLHVDVGTLVLDAGTAKVVVAERELVR